MNSRPDYWGKLKLMDCPNEVRDIWHTRDNELPDLPTHKWSFEYECNLDHVDDGELLEKIFESASGLTAREKNLIFMRFLDENTLEESAKRMLVTRERCRQIERSALRKLRRIAVSIGKECGMEIYNYGETTTWRGWLNLKQRQAREFEQEQERLRLDQELRKKYWPPLQESVEPS